MGVGGEDEQSVCGIAIAGKWNSVVRNVGRIANVRKIENEERGQRAELLIFRIALQGEM